MTDPIHPRELETMLKVLDIRFNVLSENYQQVQGIHDTLFPETRCTSDKRACYKHVANTVDSIESDMQGLRREMEMITLRDWREFLMSKRMEWKDSREEAKIRSEELLERVIKEEEKLMDMRALEDDLRRGLEGNEEVVRS